MNFWNRLKAGAAAPRAPASEAVQPYAMERTGEDSAEIVLYGNIVSERPYDWQTGKPSEEEYIVLSEFLEDLKQVEDVSHLTVRIHSVGGNAYDALVIHNRLKSLKADITVIVDGVAMSGGSLIMCAADRVQVYPSSLIMIHRCWAPIWGCYNAAELRKMADGYDAADRSQAAIYQLKTGLDTDELLRMMEAETYMTGQEAIDKGFADELAEGSGMEIAASADRRTLLVGGRPVWASVRKDSIPSSIPTANPVGTTPVMVHTPLAATREGEILMEPILEVNSTEPSTPLAPEGKAVPAAGVVAEQTVDPVQAERQRIQEIDALASLYDAETIQAAKYGETACTAQEMTYRAAQKAAKQGRTFLTDLETDAQASGVQQIGSATPASTEDSPLTPQQLMAQGRADAKALGPERKEK